MTTMVSQLLQTKSTPSAQVWSVTPQTSVLAAMQLMADKDIGAVVVLDDGRLSGIFSERDYARKVALKGLPPDTPVSAVMTRDVVCVSLEQSLDECMAIMTNKFIRHLPVVDQDQLAGMVTIRDVVKAIVLEKEGTIRTLENVVSGLAF
jgi:CBS domain-containing protein